MVAHPVPIYTACNLITALIYGDASSLATMDMHMRAQLRKLRCVWLKRQRANNIRVQEDLEGP